MKNGTGKAGTGGEPSYQEQMAELDRRWNELVYGPGPPPPKPTPEMFLVVPVSGPFVELAKARPQTLKARLTVEDGAGVTRVEWLSGVTIEWQEPDFAKSLTRAIQADKGGKGV
jgi:hypothetical protein